ncbi:unnamed protein product [Cyberlindnera jadinii]|uniref:RraA-like protein n=1 Tax=Cyberlindnera jadinii (strain ATCC 18201 / CBS 1600 / BCRC 20928 / JCM 3617 / NBRC 0987 / NRRL Y-1542) TaxID=983966 RepID=A0A0H5C4Y4_CYBJN|nr:RraA-like protein [Cyberlindnera jadinii NRRL Y-1542]ODV74444.1 RraA-like protein [Cyberlindnera jadinii NRRL Y-1542]CEP23061.1 unnamed protein product [Cyberlindnera jadinii]
MSNNVVKFLEKFTPCDVSDALVKFGHPTGGFIPNLKRFSKNAQGSSAVGKAYTVLYAPKSDPRPEVKDKYIDILPKDSIVVIALSKELQSAHAPYVKLNNAVYGGLMSTRAQYLGAKGSVIFARIRDVDEHRDLGYPVFAYGLGTAAPGPVVKVVGINVPVEVTVGEGQYETINPEDILIADENGVVKVPKDEQLIEKITEYIPKRVEADQLVAEDIKRGEEAAKAQKLRRANL